MVQQNLQDRVALLEQHRDTWNHRANRYFKYGSTYLGIAGVITTECILIQSSGFLDVRNLISDAGKIVAQLLLREGFPEAVVIVKNLLDSQVMLVNKLGSPRVLLCCLFHLTNSCLLLPNGEFHLLDSL